MSAQAASVLALLLGVSGPASAQSTESTCSGSTDVSWSIVDAGVAQSCGIFKRAAATVRFDDKGTPAKLALELSPSSLSQDARQAADERCASALRAWGGARTLTFQGSEATSAGGCTSILGTLAISGGTQGAVAHLPNSSEIRLPSCIFSSSDRSPYEFTLSGYSAAPEISGDGVNLGCFGAGSSPSK